LKQEKKRTTLYLTETADKWLTETAERQGNSKNGVIQMMINEAIKTAEPERPEKKGGWAPWK